MPIAKLYTHNDINFNAISMSLAAWAVYYEMDEKSLRTRVNKGWSLKRAIHEPIRESHSHTSARRRALLFNAKIYIGSVHKKCGSRLKYTRNGSCLMCVGKSNPIKNSINPE